MFPVQCPLTEMMASRIILGCDLESKMENIHQILNTKEIRHLKKTMQIHIITSVVGNLNDYQEENV
jgi:hypothetical protein